MFTLVVATDKNGMMSKDGNLPWHCKSDLQNFKRITENNVILMGRKTFDTFPKPLINRIHFVLCSSETKAKVNANKENYPNYFHDNVVLIDDFELFCSKSNQCALEQNKKAFVIGGKQIYDLFLNCNLVDEIYLSEIKTAVEPNESSLYFEYNPSHFKKIKEEETADYIFQIHKSCR